MENQNIVNKYQEAKIYKIVDQNSNKIYIGSTCFSIEKRLYQHEANYKRYLVGGYNYVTVFDIMGGNNYRIELIEAYRCNDKKELSRREGEIIKLNKLICVNHRIDGRTFQEYYRDNIDKYKMIHQRNIPKIRLRGRRKMLCECGAVYNYSGKTCHTRTKLHINFINNKNIAQ
jgi:hypothetical protein